MGFWSNAFKTKYIIEVVDGGRYIEPRMPGFRGKINIYAGKTQGDVVFEVPFGTKKEARLLDFAWASEEYSRSVGKTAVGAVLGGAVGGVFGAAIGGAIGARRQKEETAMLLCADPDGSIFEIEIACDKLTYLNISSLIAQ